jgi:rhodanese-related sulfurtransferase
MLRDMSERTLRHASDHRSTVRRVAAARAAIENLRPCELAAELGAPSGGAVVLIDVRSAEEHQGGSISRSINVPRGKIEMTLGTLLDPTQRIVVYCDTGARSALAAEALYELGYHDVAHLDGGLAAWSAAGRPMTGDRGDG